MNTITRQGFTKLMLLITVLLLLAAVLVFRQTQAQGEELAMKQQGLAELQNELDNMAKLSTLLNQLDSLTIDEKTSTRLNLQRHLGLEQSGYKFDVLSKQNRQLDSVALYLRQIEIDTELPYAAALALADRLHNTKKIVLNRLTLSRSSAPGQMVQLKYAGTLYGLDKNQ
jgi:hypothetical protein